MTNQTQINQTSRVYRTKKTMFSVALLGIALAAGLLWHQNVEATEKNGGKAKAFCPEGTWLLRLADGRIAKESIILGRNGKQIHFHGDTSLPGDTTIGGLFPNAQSDGVGFYGSGERIAPNAFEFRGIFHNVNVVDGTPTDIAFIGILEGVAVFPDCDTQLVTLTQSHFLPEQDADGDGIPDEGEEPFLFFTDIPVTGKRL